MKLLSGILLLAFAGHGLGAPLENLASPSQEVRDKAAAALRQSYEPAPRSTWTPLIEKLHRGQSPAEILALLKPLQVRSEGSFGSGWSYTEMFRLDNDWTISLTYERPTPHRNTVKVEMPVPHSGEDGIALARPFIMKLGGEADPPSFQTDPDGIGVRMHENPDDQLIDWRLGPSVRSIWVKPPEDFTGKWVTYYVNGRKSTQITYKLGAYFGEFIAFYPDGSRCYVQHFSKRGADGADTGYYPSGKIRYSGTYEDNKMVGKWIWYDEKGSVTSTEDRSKT